jgi:hypothetical protein
MRLEKAESNSLYKAIVEARLDPNEFDLHTNERWPGLVHKTSDSYFLFKVNRYKILPNNPITGGQYAVKSRVEPGRQSLASVYLWDNVLERASRWCSEIKEPDLWYEAEAAKEIFATANEEPDNTPFTHEEQTDISVQLTAISKSIRELYALSDEKMSQISARLDEAEKASRRMGRKDWLLLFSGTILTLIVTDIVTPDVAHHIFTMAMQGLGHLFQGGPNPPRSLPSR